MVRDDRNDLIFRTKREKFNAIMDEIERLHKMELPVLVGTTNVDVSETLSRMLKLRGMPHQGGARTGAGSGGGMVPGLASGPDPRTLATNRGEETGPKQPAHAENEPGRNDPCPCGSGKKYKKCHGR